MKLFKIKIIIIPVYAHPFDFLKNWRSNTSLYFDYLKVKRKFKKLRWTDDDIWRMTYACDNLKSAVERLCYELTENVQLFPKIRKLIYKGYDRNWSY